MWFIKVYWKSILTIVIPLLLLPIALEGSNEFKVLYLLITIVIFWVLELLPLGATSLIPIFALPLMGITNSDNVCVPYTKNTVIFFIGAMMLSLAFEYSGLPTRIALKAITVIGVSHRKLLMSSMSMTFFISMWITNAATVTLMCPLVGSLLETLENNGLAIAYTKSTNAYGEEVLSPNPVTLCYYMGILYATVFGGCATLVGTATTLSFKGLFEGVYPDAPEFMSFPMHCAFSIPWLVIANILAYFWVLILYMGMFRPGSKAAKDAYMSPEGKEATKLAVKNQLEELGPMTWHEKSMALLFSAAIILYFTRSPKLFDGWADMINPKNSSFIKDAVVAFGITLVMFLSPAFNDFKKFFKGTPQDQLPTTTSTGIVVWDVFHRKMPWSLIFLIGCGFAIAEAMVSSGLASLIGSKLKSLESLSKDSMLLVMILFCTFATNFASNVVCANLFIPIIAELAATLKRNPFYYVFASGTACSWAFHLPIGSPPFAIVQGVCFISTKDMMLAGIGPSLIAIITTFINMKIMTPIIWPDVVNINYPTWAQPKNESLARYDDRYDDQDYLA